MLDVSESPLLVPIRQQQTFGCGKAMIVFDPRTPRRKKLQNYAGAEATSSGVIPWKKNRRM